MSQPSPTRQAPWKRRSRPWLLVVVAAVVVVGSISLWRAGQGVPPAPGPSAGAATGADTGRPADTAPVLPSRARALQRPGAEAVEALAAWPDAYRPPEMNKVGDYLSAWLAERPARDVDPDPSVEVDCAQAPCLLRFTCDGRAAQAIDFGALLIRRLRELTRAQRPHVLEQELGERSEYVAYFVPPHLDSAQVEADVRRRLSLSHP